MARVILGRGFFGMAIMTMMPIRDVSLHVQMVGRGYPLLLMHGGPGLDHSTLSSLRPLADHFTLVFYDHRCNGRSTGAVRSMTWDNLTADAETLRQSLGFDEWAVLGHSFGGMVALEYALRYPEHLSRLLLLDTCGDAIWAQQRGPDMLAKRGYRASAVAAARRFFNGDLTPAEVRPIVMKFIGAYFYHFGIFSLPRALVQGFRLKARPEAHVFFFGEVLPGWSVMHRLIEIDTPTLVLAGRHDFQFPPEHQAILADRLPNGSLEIIERAGHDAHAERPVESIAAIRRFLSTLDQSALSPMFASAR